MRSKPTLSAEQLNRGGLGRGLRRTTDTRIVCNLVHYGKLSAAFFSLFSVEDEVLSRRYSNFPPRSADALISPASQEIVQSGGSTEKKESERRRDHLLES